MRISEPLGALSRITAHGRLGRQLLLDGQADRAVEALEYAASLCGDGKRIEEPWLRQALAQAWLAAGDPARARAIAEEVLTYCLEIGSRLVAIEAAVTLSAALRAETGVGGGAADRRGAGDRRSPDRRDRRPQPDAVRPRRARRAGGAARRRRPTARLSPPRPRGVHADGRHRPRPRTAAALDRMTEHAR